MKILNKSLFKKEFFNKNEYKYQQEELSPGIIHVGIGNFHRAHQAFLLDELFNQKKDMNFGIIGAGLRKNDIQMRADLQSQDFLSTVVLRDKSINEARIIQSILGFIELDISLLVKGMSKENIKIISLSITEAGYYIDSDSCFDLDHEDIQADIKNSDMPKTIFGVLLLALKNRKELKIKPFTLMSCDNIPNNGTVLKNILLKMSKCYDVSLYRYILEKVAFPNSMVDRITPTLTSKNKKYIEKNFFYSDQRPVFCEPFIQWIIEDNFCNDRPRLEDVGVLFVKDILPYERMKIRILNGSHACLSSLSALLNIKYVHKALDDSLIVDFLNKIMKEEVIPSLSIDIDVDLEEYYENVIKRFSNPYIEDSITRICMDNSSKQPKFILESLKDALKNNLCIDGLSLVCALWARYCLGFDEENRPLEINDEKEEELKEYALKAKIKAKEFLNLSYVYGDLNTNTAFINSFTISLESIYTIGIRRTVEKYNKQ